VEELERTVIERFGRVHLLMNNAGIQPGSSLFGPEENWDRVLNVNLMGIIHGTRVFGPKMIAHGEPAMIINTGSKQGITTPPGDPAYNVAKAGVKAFTEALQHELRNTQDCKVSAHLLIPGLCLHAADGSGPDRETGCRLDRGADGRFHDGEPGERRFLHPVPGQ
jgi:NAD(P)-dependent dehydrogenase (short-subunit alcohol dehydrogenase family)